MGDTGRRRAAVDSAAAHRREPAGGTVEVPGVGASRMPIFDRRFKADPQPFYRALRTRGPLAPVELPTGVRAWMVTDHALARALFVDPRLSKDSRYAGRNWHEAHVNYSEGTSRPVFAHLLTMDPPDHTRLRRLVARAFTPQQIERRRATVTTVVRTALDALPETEPIDFVSEFAMAVPLTVICELLGIPIEDRAEFRRWSELLIAADESEQALVPAAGAALSDYLLALADARRRSPDDSLFGQLVSTAARGEMTDTELAAMGFLLLVAGHETTASLLAVGLVVLLETDHAWESLGRNPASAPHVVEELVRLCTPVEVTTPRFARDRIDLGPVAIESGDTVFFSLAAVNRDPSCFHDADRFDVTRDPSGHLAFGWGAHYCLGAHLARLEATIAFTELSRRFPGLTIEADRDQLRWSPGLIMRGLRALPIRLCPEAA
jgi:cytochrome P450